MVGNTGTKTPKIPRATQIVPLLTDASFDPDELDRTGRAHLAGRDRDPSRQTGLGRGYRGHLAHDLFAAIKIRHQFRFDADLTQRAVDAITTGAQTGKIGDGKIWVSDVSRLVRIRTGEQGPDAL